MPRIVGRVVCGVVMAGAETAPAKGYDRLLLVMGAFPVAKLTKPYFTNGHPGQVYGKGNRENMD